MENRTNILVWNLQYFAIGKITTFTEGAQMDPDHPDWNPGLNRNYNDFYLGFVVNDLNPDIFVVLEAMSTPSNRGSLIQGGGTEGLLKLLGDLRMRNRNWNLVPAVRQNPTYGFGYTEGVGVFYRGDRLQFTGPMIWPGGSDLETVAIAAGTGVPSQYPEPWNDCLPNRNVRIGNIFYPENAMAGQAVFRYGPLNDEVGFPVSFCRSPFLTTFVESHGSRRNIALASVHLPRANQQFVPKNPEYIGISGGAKAAIRQIYAYIPIIASPPANTVSIVAGDFNIDRNKPSVERDLYGKTNTKGYEWMYVAGQSSMYKRTTEGTPENYLGPAINDNVLLRYGPNVEFVPKRGMIGDIVEGAGQSPGIMDPPLPLVPATILPSLQKFRESKLPVAVRDASFQEPPNYGHVAHAPGLSDHRFSYFEV